MSHQRISAARGIAVVFFALAISIAAPVMAAGKVPKSVGPQGFLIWESPRTLPELAFEDEDGRPLTLADFKGKAILLNIWATWCLPCREEMPTLDSLQAQLGGEQFEVVALSV
ncbi:TlpA family protein disulfide reductase, partial [Halopseudomonas sp.]